MFCNKTISLSHFLRAGSSIPSLWLLWYALGWSPTGPWASWAIHGRNDLWPSTGVPKSSITALPAGKKCNLQSLFFIFILSFPVLYCVSFILQVEWSRWTRFLPVWSRPWKCAVLKRKKKKIPHLLWFTTGCCDVNSRALPNSFQYLVLLTEWQPKSVGDAMSMWS